MSNLTVGGIYKFYVVSRNENGTSLPSSILTLNMSKAAWNGIEIQGKIIIFFTWFLGFNIKHLGSFDILKLLLSLCLYLPQFVHFSVCEFSYLLAVA